MIRFHTSDQAPHIHVEAAGTITAPTVRANLDDLPAVLDEMEPGFVLLAEYPDLVLIGADAVGPLFYYIARLFDAEPGLAVFVTGGEQRHPGLRAFMTQIDLQGVLHVVDTRADADRLIAEFTSSS